MNKKQKLIFTVLAIIVLLVITVVVISPTDDSRNFSKPAVSHQDNTDSEGGADNAAAVESLHPMAIESLRNRVYPGGAFSIERQLDNDTNYRQYVASYMSDGNKIYGLLTVPLSEMPEGGFPAIMFIHGYIPPKQYSTTGNYSTYQARLARAGFVTYKPDLRGHGNSEGAATSSNLTEAYVVDTMFAMEYLKNYEDVNPDRIGYWGHSNGGGIGLKLLLISEDVQSASLWAGMVGSYEDMLETYKQQIPFMRRDFNSLAIKEKGFPGENPEFWATVDPYYFLADINAPVQLQHGTEDDGQVPVELSRHLQAELEKLGKTVEYWEYEGDNHNLSNNVETAFSRAVNFYIENL